MFARSEAQSTKQKQMRGGLCLFATGSIAAGILDLLWGDFEPAHQPIQGLGDHIPGRAILAFVAALWLIGGGTAILFNRLARAGALALGAIYLIFAAFWLPRFYTAVQALGLRIAVVVGLVAGIGQQLILVAAAAVVYGSLTSSGFDSNSGALLLIRWTFGLSSVAFGLAHLTGAPQVAAMVPKWIPLGGNVWAVVTGIAFVAAGIAVLSQVLDVVAARLLAVMLFLFSILVLAPAPLARPHDHVAWGSNAYNLAAVGAAWIFANSIAIRRLAPGNAVNIDSNPPNKEPIGNDADDICEFRGPMRRGLLFSFRVQLCPRGRQAIKNRVEDTTPYGSRTTSNARLSSRNAMNLVWRK